MTDTTKNATGYTVEPPSDDDWVLVVDDAARGFGPPGQRPI